MCTNLNKARILYCSDFGKRYTDRSNTSLIERNNHTISETGESISRSLSKIISNTSGVVKILEIGCGLGHNLELLKEFGSYSLTGIDIQEYALSKARVKYQGIDFINGDCANLPFDDREFDLVFSRVTLIHIHPEEIKRVAEEMMRVSSKYIAGIEYFSENIQEINWRGENDSVWKMNYHSVFRTSSEIKTIYCELVPISKEKYNKDSLFYQHYLIEKGN